MGSNNRRTTHNFSEPLPTHTGAIVDGVRGQTLSSAALQSSLPLQTGAIVGGMRGQNPSGEIRVIYIK